MKKGSRIYTLLLGVIFVAIVAMAAGPGASGTLAFMDVGLGILPPSQELWERVERDEVEFPQVEPVYAEFSGYPTVGAAPITVNFTNLSTGPMDTCLWEFGDEKTDTSCGNPTHIYTDLGSYDVSLTVYDSGGGSDTEVKVNYIHAGEPVDSDFIGTPTSGLALLTVNFTNLSTGMAHCTWDFGDGKTDDNCDDPSNTYTSTGVYTVSLSGTGAAGADTETKINYITVYDPVTAEFSGTPEVGAAPMTVNFTNLSTGPMDTCLWEFGDEKTDTSCSDPTYTYTLPGSYNVSLTVDGLGGDSDTETKVDYIVVTQYRLFLPIILR